MQKKPIPTETIIRAIVLFVTLVNTILTMSGKNPLPFAEDELYTWLSAAATVAATLWAWWKNNSFTSAAITADEYMAKLKAQGTNTNAETEE